MASAVLSTIRQGNVSNIQETIPGHTSFVASKRLSTIEEILPFRIKFTALQIPAVGPGVVPPIPLQIIGYSNYIL